MDCNGFQHASDIDTTRVLNALAHPARLQIVRQLAGVPVCCCKDIVARLDLAQSTVSQHLKILVDAGLVQFQQNGHSSRYSINTGAFAEVAMRVSDLANLCCPTATTPGTGTMSLDPIDTRNDRGQ